MSSEAFVALAAVLFNLSVLAGTAYIVFWLGHSGWWFVLAVLCLLSVKSS